MITFQRFARTSTQTKVHAVGGGTIIAIAVLLSVITTPALSRRWARLDLRASVDAADVRLLSTQAQISHARAEIQTLTAVGAAHASASPASLDRRLMDVSSIAAELGLLVDSTEPGGVIKQPTGESLTSIAATGHGPYTHVVALVHLLHERVPDLTVEAFTLTPNADRSCTFRLSLNWWDAPLPTAHEQVVSGAEDGR